MRSAANTVMLVAKFRLRRPVAYRRQALQTASALWQEGMAATLAGARDGLAALENTGQQRKSGKRKSGKRVYKGFAVAAALPRQACDGLDSTLREDLRQASGAAIASYLALVEAYRRKLDRIAARLLAAPQVLKLSKIARPSKKYRRLRLPPRPSWPDTVEMPLTIMGADGVTGSRRMALLADGRHWWALLYLFSPGSGLTRAIAGDGHLVDPQRGPWQRRLSDRCLLVPLMSKTRRGEGRSEASWQQQKFLDAFVRGDALPKAARLCYEPYRNGRYTSDRWYLHVTFAFKTPPAPTRHGEAEIADRETDRPPVLAIHVRFPKHSKREPGRVPDISVAFPDGQVIDIDNEPFRDRVSDYNLRLAARQAERATRDGNAGQEVVRGDHKRREWTRHWRHAVANDLAAIIESGGYQAWLPLAEPATWLYGMLKYRLALRGLPAPKRVYVDMRLATDDGARALLARASDASPPPRRVRLATASLRPESTNSSELARVESSTDELARSP